MLTPPLGISITMEALRTLNKKKLDQLLLSKTEEEFTEWLQSVGLLHKRRLCPGKDGVICEKEMKLVTAQGSKKWRCGVKDCRKSVGFRVGTLFENQNLSFKTVCSTNA
jgi:hypothetical protein